MSYTMTFDMPEVATAFVKRQGPRFRSELNALFLAIIQTRMQYEKGDAEETSPQTPLDFVSDWGRLCVREGELDLSRTNDTLREVDFG